jgi:Polyketide cyclase / dehydrase and lipid transport
MMIALYIVLGLIALVILLALVAPKNYHVSRSVTVNKPIAEVFNYIKYVKKQNEWSPWKKKDPNMKQEYIGTDGEVGFLAKWEGNKDVGTGEQEITKVVENKSLESQLRFFKPWKSQSNAFITVDEIDANSTKVTWGFSGVNKPPSNIFFLFFNMDKTVGKDFQEGLNDLKHNLES